MKFYKKLLNILNIFYKNIYIYNYIKYIRINFFTRYSLYLKFRYNFLYINSYRIFSNNFFLILFKNKSFLFKNKFKEYCLYTNRKRSVFIKYKMSRLKLKKNIDNLNFLNYSI